MASKIVVAGPFEGNFQYFTKLAKLHAKTGFSFALIAGDLFAAPDAATEDNAQAVDALIKGEIEVSLPTYFTVGRNAIPRSVIERIEANEGEVCTNLYYLDKRSTTTTSEGIRLVALGGQLDKQIVAGESKDRFLPVHTENDARTLRGANRADILLTTHWPSSICEGSGIPLPKDCQVPQMEQCVADLCASLRPRYHFSTSSDMFWEREPFAHPPTDTAPDARPVTRFLSLASPVAASKAKWIYAFTLDPKAGPTDTVPNGVTPSPFSLAARKRMRPSNSTQPPATTGMRNPKRRKRPAPPPGPDECFFCLANPNIATHILTSIGDAAYLSTARGPLLERTTFAELPFQSHTLIIPLGHAATLATIADAGEAENTFKEMQRYRSALQSMVAVTTKGQFGSITWELSRATGVHIHWQFLPLPRRFFDDGLLDAAFRVQTENDGLPVFESRDIGNGSSEGDYFRIWLWVPDMKTWERSDSATLQDHDGTQDRMGSYPPGSEVQLILSLRDVPRFDASFGRRVIAQLLEMEKRADWKECTQTAQEETQDADAFKEAFKSWDFALA